MPKRIITFCLVLMAVVLVLTGPAAAYVLHGAHVLELMWSELGQARQLFAQQALLVYNDAVRVEPIQLNETVMYRFPDAFRSEIKAPTATRIELTNHGRTLTVLDNQIVEQRDNELGRYKDLLLFNSRELLEDKLPFWGIDVSVSSLGRFQGKIAYVIGAHYPDETSPQIWIDKDTLHPFRWIIRGKRVDANDGGAVEIRYLQWRQVDDIQFPMRIEFYRSDRLVRELRVNTDTVRVNPNLPEELFSLEVLKNKYPTARLVPSEPRDSDDTDEVQKTLQEFNKIFE